MDDPISFSNYGNQNEVSICNSIDDETSTGGSGSSRRESSPIQNDPLSSPNDIMEYFAYNDLKLELENAKNKATINTIGDICDEHISRLTDSNDELDNLEKIYNHLQKIKNRIDVSISILECEKSLLDSPSPMNTLEYISPKSRIEKDSNPFPSNELMEGTGSDQEDSLIKIPSKQSKDDLQRSGIPIECVQNQIKSQFHYKINRINAFINTFEFISDLARVGVSTIKLVKGDDVDQYMRGVSPLVYLDPIFQDDSYYEDAQLSKKRVVLRLRKESFEKSFLDSLPKKGRLNLRLKGQSPKPDPTPKFDCFAPRSYSDILYLDTVDFTSVLNLIAQHETLDQETISLEISPFDIHLGTFPTFEHVELAIYLPYLPSSYSDVNFELWDTTKSVSRVASFISKRQRMINKVLREEAIAYERCAELDRRRQLLMEAKIRASGSHDIFAWGCLPVRANDLPDQFVPLPAGYCQGDREFPYDNAAFLRSEVEGGEKKNDNGNRNMWMQSCYFNLTGAPLFWRNSAIMELAPRFRPIDHNKPRTRGERVRKIDPSPSVSIEDPYPIEILNCRRGGKFTLYRNLYSLENAIRFGNTFNRDDDPKFTYYEKSISTVWTFSQVRTFIIKYLLYPKNFGKIASFLDSKSVGDCVDFYYKFKYKLRLKERLADVRMRIPGSANLKSKQDIKRHEKRDYHLIDSLFSDNIPRDLYSPITWPFENAPQLDEVISANGLVWSVPYTANIPTQTMDSDNLDWRRLYRPIYHLDNLREGYFLPTDISSLFTTQSLVVPTSFLPLSPHALTLRGSIHLANDSRTTGSDCVSFAVCHALATLARLPKDVVNVQGGEVDGQIKKAPKFSPKFSPKDESLISQVDDNQSVDDVSTSTLMGVAWKLMDPIPPISVFPHTDSTIIPLSSRLLEAIPMTESPKNGKDNVPDTSPIYDLERLNISKNEI